MNKKDLAWINLFIKVFDKQRANKKANACPQMLTNPCCVCRRLKEHTKFHLLQTNKPASLLILLTP